MGQGREDVTTFQDSMWCVRYGRRVVVSGKVCRRGRVLRRGSSACQEGKWACGDCEPDSVNSDRRRAPLRGRAGRQRLVRRSGDT